MQDEPLADVIGDIRGDGQMHSLMELVQPYDKEVKRISEILNIDNRFVPNCMDFVGNYIRYRTTTIGLWLTPSEVLELQEGDCEKTSILLASLLRTIYSGEDVFVVLGLVNEDGQEKGHAWVELNEQILESTRDSHFLMDASKYKALLKFNDYRAYEMDKNPFGYMALSDRYQLALR